MPLSPQCGAQLSLKAIKEIKLIEDNKEYLITIGKSSIFQKLGFRIKESSLQAKKCYENYFSLEELKNLCKYFRIFENLNEVISMIEEEDLFNEKQINLKEVNEKVYLILKINKMGKGEEIIDLELNQKYLTLDEICENLINEINYLKNKEIKSLKEEIKYLREENNKKNLIIKEILEWKNKMQKGMDNIIDSKIIKKEEELNLITNRLKQIESFKNKYITYELIFRATRDGNTPKDFHEKCDGIEKTITLVKTVKGLKFGGYISYKYNNKKGWISDDEDCFIFSINNMKIYNPIKGKKKYLFSQLSGPIFTAFGIKENLFEKSTLNIQTKDNANKYFSEFTSDYEINGGENEFQAEEIEFFKIVSL